MKKFITFLIFTAGISLSAQVDTVTFRVDMNSYTGSFTSAFVNGDYNSWCGSCNPMTDADMDGIWEAKLPITSDSIEYKFTVDGWNDQESLVAGSPCTKTTSGFTNRFLVLSGDTIMPVVCWGSCGSCSILQQIDLPITYDDPTVQYMNISFGGNSDTIVPDPANPSNMVVQMLKGSGAQTWAGTTLSGNGLANAIPFSSTSNHMSVDVWSPDSGTTILLKVEDQNDPTISVETKAYTTKTGTWENLSFDFSQQATGTAAIDYSKTYDKVSIFPNFGVDGATAGAKTYYADNIMFGSPMQQVDLPITFDDMNVNYGTVSFGGAEDSLMADPANAANMVLKLVKTTSAQTWGGTVVGTDGLANPVPFSSGNTYMNMKVWSPDSGTPFLLKVENNVDANISVETIAYTTLSGNWEVLNFNFANNTTGTPPLDFTKDYEKVVVFPNFGVDGATSGMKTYYIDDIAFGASLGQNEIYTQTMHLYPNPSNGRVYIDGLTGGKMTIQVLDLQGRIVWNNELVVNSNFGLDLSALSAGTYILSATDGKFSTTSLFTITQ